MAASEWRVPPNAGRVRERGDRLAESVETARSDGTMTESDTIERTPQGPYTVDSLSDDLTSLGLTGGMIVLVHSSLSSLGWVCGGAVGVVLALEQALGAGGTLVMPTHSGDLSDPAHWKNPAVPEAWWQSVRDTMPAYDPLMTPVRGVGTIPEVFRRQSGVTRSLHPNYSFAAWGRESEHVTRGEKLDYSMDLDSPLGRVYELDGYVLLLGVGHESNTSLHLAEYLVDIDGRSHVDCFAPVLRGGVRRWEQYRDVDLDSDDFEDIGAAFEATGACRIGKVGNATAKLMRQKELVDFAVDWMREHRAGPAATAGV
jgi:aminoglycoside 3-N-acetyltransferase